MHRPEIPAAARSRRAFASFLVADALFGSAEDMIVVAVGWLVFSRTRSTFDLGMIGLAGFLPLMLLSLVTGFATDRFDRRLVLAVCGAGLCAGAVMLCVAAAGSAIWPVYVIVVLIGSAKAFLGPVSKALVPNLVAAGELTRGLALTNSFGGTARLLAPALGGLLYAAGPLVPFGAAAVLSALGVLSCIGIGARPPETAAATANWSTLVAGFV